jgi:hypothetical protein
MILVATISRTKYMSVKRVDLNTPNNNAYMESLIICFSVQKITDKVPDTYIPQKQRAAENGSTVMGILTLSPVVSLGE